MASTLALCWEVREVELRASVCIYWVLDLFVHADPSSPPPRLTAGFLFTLCATFPLTPFP